MIPKRKRKKVAFYERIVFAQGENADEFFKIYDEDGFLAAIDYMAQWHYPGEHETTKEPAAGSRDRVFYTAEEDGFYLLTVSPQRLYMGLEYAHYTA